MEGFFGVDAREAFIEGSEEAFFGVSMGRFFFGAWLAALKAPRANKPFGNAA